MNEEFRVVNASEYGRSTVVTAEEKKSTKGDPTDTRTTSRN